MKEMRQRDMVPRIVAIKEDFDTGTLASLFYTQHLGGRRTAQQRCELVASVISVLTHTD